MKKVYLFVLGLLFSLVLAGCTQTKNQEPSSATASITITADNHSDTKEVSFETGDTVMDVLEENYSIEEESGMVTSIDGRSQDPATNTYWMYTVNGTLAEKGAAEQVVAEGDTIEFYLETID